MTTEELKMAEDLQQIRGDIQTLVNTSADTSAKLNALDTYTHDRMHELVDKISQVEHDALSARDKVDQKLDAIVASIAEMRQEFRDHVRDEEKWRGVVVELQQVAEGLTPELMNGFAGRVSTIRKLQPYEEILIKAAEDSKRRTLLLQNLQGSAIKYILAITFLFLAGMIGAGAVATFEKKYGLDKPAAIVRENASDANKGKKP